MAESTPVPSVSDLALAVDSFYTSLRTLAHMGDKLLQAPAQAADVALVAIENEAPQVVSSLPQPVRETLVAALLAPVKALDSADHVALAVLDAADTFIQTGKLPSEART